MSDHFIAVLSLVDQLIDIIAISIEMTLERSLEERTRKWKARYHHSSLTFTTNFLIGHLNCFESNEFLTFVIILFNFCRLSLSRRSSTNLNALLSCEWVLICLVWSSVNLNIVKPILNQYREEKFDWKKAQPISMLRKMS